MVRLCNVLYSCIHKDNLCTRIGKYGIRLISIICDLSAVNSMTWSGAAAWSSAVQAESEQSATHLPPSVCRPTDRRPEAGADMPGTTPQRAAGRRGPGTATPPRRCGGAWTPLRGAAAAAD